MPLESLNNEQINIHDLTIEEKEKKPTPEWQRQYEVLKETPLYDKERNQWREFMNSSQNLMSPYIHSKDQFLSILVELQIDKSSAEEQYYTLKESELYDSKKKRWNQFMNENQHIHGPEYKTGDQLGGIFIELQFDRESAKKSYDALKKSKLYDSKMNQWNEEIDEKGKANTDNKTIDQLFGIIVESQFDIASAQKSYETLKKTKVYISDNKQWFNSLYDNQKAVGQYIYADVQLLGFLVESQFDKPLAQKLYRTLKETRLYDEKTKQWNRDINENQSVNKYDRYASAQLLGILCEKELGEPIPDFNPITPPLPEERNY